MRTLLLLVVAAAVLAVPATSSAHGIHSGNWHGYEKKGTNCTLRSYVAIPSGNTAYRQVHTSAVCNSSRVNVACVAQLRLWPSGQMIASAQAAGRTCTPATGSVLTNGSAAYNRGFVCAAPASNPQAQNCLYQNSPVL